MIAPGDAPRIRERHVLDCLRAASLIAPEDRLAYDLGSGAGLPGVVIAIVCPTLGVTLVEGRRHRSDFLNEVVIELGLANVKVHAGRAESLVERVDVCLSRAFAPAGTAWKVAERLLGPAGRSSTGPDGQPTWPTNWGGTLRGNQCRPSRARDPAPSSSSGGRRRASAAALRLWRQVRPVSLARS